MNKPPFTLTTLIVNTTIEIAKLMGSIETSTLLIPNPKLRKKNKIASIKSTLAIEGHTFTEEQITAILENKRVLGTKKEILEVQNAIALYENIDKFNPIKSKDLLKAHGILMKGLISESGRFRLKNVGILKGTKTHKVKHVAPKPNLVPELVTNLLNWMKQESDLNPLILSCIIHYEIEFIHPFEDGNGRMGRFWQALILKEYNPIFCYLPIESLIEKNQREYYDTLEKSDQAGDSTCFIEFMLKIIRDSLSEMSNQLTGTILNYESRILKAQDHFKNKNFSRNEYMSLFKNISTSTASRDLKNAVDEQLIIKSGEKNQSIYPFLKKIAYKTNMVGI